MSRSQYTRTIEQITNPEALRTIYCQAETADDYCGRRAVLAISIKTSWIANGRPASLRHTVGWCSVRHCARKWIDAMKFTGEDFGTPQSCMLCRDHRARYNGSGNRPTTCYACSGVRSEFYHEYGEVVQ